MKKEIKVGPYIYPMPVIMLATFNEDGSVNVMNAAWGTVVDNNELAICLSSHKTTENFKRTKGVVIQLSTVKNIAEADYLGMVSGNKIKDKFAKTGLHYHKAEKVDAPIIDEFPVAMECEYLRVDEPSGIHFFRILRVEADESVIDEKGHLDLSKCDAVLFSGLDGKYCRIGEEAAKAFNVGTKFLK